MDDELERRPAGNQINALVGVNVVGGFRGGPGNAVSCVRLAGNRVTAREAVSVRPNVEGAVGNRASLRC